MKPKSADPVTVITVLITIYAVIKGLKAAFRVLENLDGVILKDGNKENVENRVSYQNKVR